MDKYICQLKNGYMMTYNDEKGDLGVAHTGYPYPDTPKSNALMLQELFQDKLGIYESEEFYITNYDRVISYFKSQHGEFFYPDFSLSGLADVMFGNTCIERLALCYKIYDIAKYGHYRMLLLKNKKSSELSYEDDKILIVKNNKVNRIRILRSGQFRNKVFSAFIEILRNTYKIDTSTSGVEKFLSLVAEVYDSEGVDFEVFDFSLIKFASVGNTVALRTYKGRDCIKSIVVPYVCAYANANYNFGIKESEFIELCEFSSFNIVSTLLKRYSFESYSYPRLLILFYCINKNLDDNCVISYDVDTCLMEFSEFVLTSALLDAYVNELIRNFAGQGKDSSDVYNAVIIDVSSKLSNGFLDVFYNRIADFNLALQNNDAIKVMWRARVSSTRNICKPTHISSNRIEWNVMDKFDSSEDDLYEVLPLLYNMLGDSGLDLRSGYLGDTDEDGKYVIIDELMSDLFQNFGGNNIKGLVFEADKYTSIRNELIDFSKHRPIGVYDGIRYYIDLRDIEPILGHFNLFGRLFCHRTNSTYFKEAVNQSCFSGVWVYKYKFCVRGHITDMSEEMFEGVRGAVILDFIAWLLDTANLIDCDITLRNIIISFKEETQEVTAQYDPYARLD